MTQKKIQPEQIDASIVTQSELDAAGYLTPTSTSTLTNKRIDPRSTSTTSTSSLTPDVSAADFYMVTALATNLTIDSPAGISISDVGTKLMIYIKDNGTARTLTWHSNFKPIGVTLPTTTVANKKLYVGVIYNNPMSSWDVIAVAQEA